MLSKPHNHSLMNNCFIEDSSSDDQNEDQKSGLTQLGAIEKLALYRRQIKMQMMSRNELKLDKIRLELMGPINHLHSDDHHYNLSFSNKKIWHAYDREMFQDEKGVETHRSLTYLDFNTSHHNVIFSNKNI